MTVSAPGSAPGQAGSIGKCRLADTAGDSTGVLNLTADVASKQNRLNTNSAKQDGAHPELKVHRVESKSRIQLLLGGHLDVYSVPFFSNLLLAVRADHREVVVDLRALNFIDSSGLRILENEVTRARRAGRSFRVVNARGQVVTACGLTRLAQGGDQQAGRRGTL